MIQDTKNVQKKHPTSDDLFTSVGSEVQRCDVATLRRCDVATLQPPRYGQDSGPLDEVRQVEDVRAAAWRLSPEGEWRERRAQGKNALKPRDIHGILHGIKEVINYTHETPGTCDCQAESVALLWGLF